MNIYIGCDIEEISRFEDKQNNKHFLNKIYTQKELDYSLNKAQTTHHLAVRFCAKEAVYKAMSSCGIENITYLDIEIENQKNGAPIVNILKPLDSELEIKISLSHCKTHAMAQAMIIKK